MSRYIDADSLAKKIMRAWELWDKKGEDCFVFSDIVTPIMVNEPTADVVEQTRWIPVSERLPEDRREVLVTAYWHETYQVMMASYFGDGLWWCVPFNNCGEHMQRLKPKAWMPLPEPYKVE